MKNLCRVLSLLCLGFCLSALAGAQTSVTALVLCDADCHWKLDGQPMGMLVVGFAKFVPVSPGEHVLEAAALDGVATFQTKVKVDHDQQILDLRLQSEDYRQSNLQRAETAGQPAGAGAALDRTAPGTTALDTTWTDPATGLTWAGKDNGLDVNWHQASAYCSNLKLSGLSGWRLPSVEELQGIFDPSVARGKWDAAVWQVHAKGNLKVSGWSWSSSQSNQYSGTDPLEAGKNPSAKKVPVRMGAFVFMFTHPVTGAGFPFGFGYNTRALCVRDSGNDVSEVK
jgi:hypothetical protein